MKKLTDRLAGTGLTHADKIRSLHDFALMAGELGRRATALDSCYGAGVGYLADELYRTAFEAWQNACKEVEATVEQLNVLCPPKFLPLFSNGEV